MTHEGTARLTVLVVDDIEDSRFVLRRMLETQDFRVVEAADGREALEFARRASPDLILMDLNMPGIDGLAAASQIRGFKGPCERVPIVALTAYDTYGMKEAALEAGCDEYLVKPINFDHFNRVLRRLLAGW
jgi:two-component system cell cycle response regulator DivK